MVVATATTGSPGRARATPSSRGGPDFASCLASRDGVLMDRPDRGVDCETLRHR